MKIDTPKITANLEKRSMYDIFEGENFELSTAQIEDAAFEEKNVEHLHLFNVVVKHSSFASSILQNVDLMDVRFENRDFSNAYMRRASVHRVERAGGAVGDTIWFDCE